MSCPLVGIDPGKSGALAFYGPDCDAFLSVVDMPLTDEGKVSGPKLWALFDFFNPGIIAFEALHGPDHFKIGYATGVLEGIAEAYGTLLVEAESSRFRIVRFPVTTWQKEMLGEAREKETKRESVRVASTLVSRDSLIRKGRTPDHNRADSVCIAAYARRNYL